MVMEQLVVVVVGWLSAVVGVVDDGMQAVTITEDLETVVIVNIIAIIWQVVVVHSSFVGNLGIASPLCQS